MKYSAPEGMHDDLVIASPSQRGASAALRRGRRAGPDRKLHEVVPAVGVTCADEDPKEKR